MEGGFRSFHFRAIQLLTAISKKKRTIFFYFVGLYWDLRAMDKVSILYGGVLGHKENDVAVVPSRNAKQNSKLGASMSR